MTSLFVSGPGIGIMNQSLQFNRLRVALLLAAVVLVSATIGCKTTELGSSDGGFPPARQPEPEETPELAPPIPKLRRSSSSPIRAGDTLELFVDEDDSFNGKYPVREKGDIIIPSVGRIPVSGLSVVDAGTKIMAALENTSLQQATVMVDRTSMAVEESPTVSPAANRAASRKPQLTIYMTGKVARPGQHRVPLPDSGSIGVYDAILISGGLSQFGDPQKVHVLRNDSEGKKHKIPVNIRMIENGMAKDPQIGDGDIVVVPEKVFGF